MTDPYYVSRYVWNNDRQVVWKEIVRFLSDFIPVHGTVLDVGAGYCDFINTISAKHKIALDYSPDCKNFASKDVRVIQSPVTDMTQIENNSVDLIFASNLFEHLSDDELALTMGEVKRTLKTHGRLVLMQPNYRLSYKTYFDDPTHKKVFSDLALRSFLISHDFEIIKMMPRFLPFSLKSRPGIIPLFPWLVRAYLHSPIKLFAGQMLFVAEIKK